MMFRKIAIVGVGLIGGSIGMACHKKKIAKQVVGVGRRRSSINKALRCKAIDQGTLNLKQGISQSDLIIVATPVNIVLKKLKECVKNANSKAIIIDVTSIKEKIVKQADKIVKNKKNISFIGTHPMAGSEESGVMVARPNLFSNSICIITPSKGTNKIALMKIKRFWKALGANTVIMSASKHDLAVANISHLPHLLAYGLCACAPSKDLILAGGGFKDLTRIAKSDPAMWGEIFIQNKTNILKVKKVFDKSLKLLESCVAKNKKKNLLKNLSITKRKRDSIG